MRESQLRRAAIGRGGTLQRVRLRWLTVAITLAGVLAFLVLAAVDRRAAPIALAGALLIAVKGLAWLLVLRRHRVRLRRHGFRW
jgi:hypothetical protein